MAKATRAKEGTTPKNRSRKTKPEDGIGTQVAEPVTTSPAQSVESLTQPVAKHAVPEQPHIEEKIRRRAYELYLQRKGQGGSPEQDWLQAVKEISSQFVA